MSFHNRPVQGRYGIGDSLWWSAIEWWLKFGKDGLSQNCNFAFGPGENGFGVFAVSFCGWGFRVENTITHFWFPVAVMFHTRPTFHKLTEKYQLVTQKEKLLLCW